MIFVTVGTQLPFDRLIKLVDQWAEAQNKEIFAQIGPTDWKPKFIEAVQFLDPMEHNEKMQAATAVISHAGMGTILTSLYMRKPILIMPRRANLREHRSDHQLATARRFENKPGVLVAWNETDMAEQLNKLEGLTLPEGISKYASRDLVKALSDFIGA